MGYISALPGTGRPIPRFVLRGSRRRGIALAPRVSTHPHAFLSRRDNVSRDSACGPSWLLSAGAVVVIAAAVAIWMLAFGGHSNLQSESVAPEAAHASNSLVGGESASVIGHPHLVNGDSSGTHPEAFASAVLPNSPSSVLVGLGMALAVAAVAAWLAPRVVLAGRGPPSAPATALTGQDLLTRLGLSRR